MERRALRFFRPPAVVFSLGFPKRYGSSQNRYCSFEVEVSLKIHSADFRRTRLTFLTVENGLCYSFTEVSTKTLLLRFSRGQVGSARWYSTDRGRSNESNLFHAIRRFNNPFFCFYFRNRIRAVPRLDPGSCNGSAGSRSAGCDLYTAES